MNDTPTRFGKYELVDRLGAGGMAIVYRARYTVAPGITKHVVIKRVLAHYAEDPAFVKMFIHEARISVGLNHGNIVQVFDFGQVDGEYYLAMELVDGQPLSRILKRAQRFGLLLMPPPLAVSIAIEMCKGLHHAHTRQDEKGRPLGLVHRDISPDNVLISYEGEVKISDFGIAKAQVVGRPVTEVGMVKGTYPYLSPEQARGLNDVDARGDVYAVGVVLYLMLCGQLPAEGDELSVLQRVMKGQLTPPLELNPDLDGGLVKILQDALATDRDVRTPSAEALHQQLSQWLSTRAPLFPVHALKHLLGVLYEAELIALGREPQLPPKFLEQVELWSGSRPRIPSRPEVPAVPSGPQQTMAAPVTRAAPAPKRGSSASTRALPAASGPAPSMPVTEDLPVQTEDLEEQTEEQEPADPSAITTRVPSSRQLALKAAEEEEELTARRPVRTHHFWLWIALVASLTALGVKFTMSYLTRIPPLAIRSEPTGALVRVDGMFMGTTPLTVEGVSRKETHTVEVSLPTMQSWVRRFDPGSLGEELHATLEPEVKQAPQAPSKPSTSPASPPEESFASRLGTDKTPARFTVQEKWHSFSVTSRSLRTPLDLRRSYTVWTSGSYTGDAPISEQELRQGLTPDALRSTQVYAFLEGEAVPSVERLFTVSSKPRALPNAQALHVFVLVAERSERNADRDLTLNIRDNSTRKVVKRKLDTKRYAQAISLETRYSVRQLDPEASYTVTIQTHEGAPASALAVLAVPRLGERVQFSGQPSGELRYGVPPGRYTVRGAQELWFALPRWEHDGSAEMDVSVIPEAAAAPEPDAPAPP